MRAALRRELGRCDSMFLNVDSQVANLCLEANTTRWGSGICHCDSKCLSWQRNNCVSAGESIVFCHFHRGICRTVWPGWLKCKTFDLFLFSHSTRFSLSLTNRKQPGMWREGKGVSWYHAPRLEGVGVS